MAWSHVGSRPLEANELNTWRILYWIFVVYGHDKKTGKLSGSISGVKGQTITVKCISHNNQWLRNTLRNTYNKRPGVKEITVTNIRNSNNIDHLVMQYTFIPFMARFYSVFWVAEYILALKFSYTVGVSHGTASSYFRASLVLHGVMILISYFCGR